MNDNMRITISVLLLIISLLANAYLGARVNQLNKINIKVEKVVSRIERLTVQVGLLTFALNDKLGLNLPMEK